jgi:hypothetical protein
VALVNLYHSREKQQNGLVHHIDEKCVTADKVEWGDVGVNGPIGVSTLFKP